MKINHRDLYIIAEMSANHGGSYKNAVDLIYAAKEAGADAIKIQTYTEDTMTIKCDNEYFKIEEGLWKGESLYDLYKRAKTPWQWQESLKKEAGKLDLDFLSTAYDITSVDFLENIGIEAYKIASFEITDIPLIKYIASKNKPIFLSTGNASLEEIKDAVDVVRAFHNNIYILKCSSEYPASPENMNLKTINNLKEVFNLRVGLSDHSLSSISAVCAVALGATIFEKHICLKNVKTADSPFSLNKDQFKSMVDNIREAKKALGEVSYEVPQEAIKNLKFRRSIFAVADIKKGERLTSSNIKVIRPSYGLPPKYFEEILGREAICEIKRGTPISWDVLN